MWRIFNSGYDCRNRTPPHRELFNCGTFTKGFVCGGCLTVVMIAGIVHHLIVNFLIVAHLQKGLCVADIYSGYDCRNRTPPPIVNSLLVAHLKEGVCVWRLFNSDCDCRNSTPPHCEFFTCCTFTKGFVCGGYLTVVTIAGIVHHPIVNSLIVAHSRKGLCVADI